MHDVPKICFCFFIIQSRATVDYLLLCICSVIDQRIHISVRSISLTRSAITLCAPFLFRPHFDIICDVLLNTTKWNLFVLTVSVIVGRPSLFLRHLSLGQCWLTLVDECIRPVAYPKIEERGCWHRLSLHTIQVAFWLESSLMFSHKNTT